MTIEQEGQPATSVSLSPTDALAFEQAAAELLAMFRATPVTPTPNPPWQPDVPVAGNLTENDFIGPIWHGQVDDRGAVEKLTLTSKTSSHTFSRDGLSLLDALAERWALHPALTNLSTTLSMRERLLAWCAERVGSTSQVPSVTFILDHLRAELGNHEVWVQLGGLDVEDRLPVGRVELRGIDRQRIDIWTQAQVGKDADPEKRARVTSELTETWQGRTAAVYRGFGDRGAVIAAAIEHAERACALLRVVGPSASHATSRSYVLPLTLLAQLSARELITDPETPQAWLFSEVFPSPPHTYGIPRSSVAALWEHGSLRHIHELLCADPASDFQKHLLGAALVHSRQRLTTDPIEKLIFSVTALETMLYAGDPDARQGTLKRRLGSVLAGNTFPLDDINQTVKSAYRLRKQFLHHGQRIDDLRAVEQFLLLAESFFRLALANHMRWPTITACCAELDECYRARFETGGAST